MRLLVVSHFVEDENASAECYIKYLDMVEVFRDLVDFCCLNRIIVGGIRRPNRGRPRFKSNLQSCLRLEPVSLARQPWATGCLSSSANIALQFTTSVD